MLRKVILANNRHAWEEVPEFPKENHACVLRNIRLELPFLSFNPSLMYDGERLRLVYRQGRCGSTLWQCQLLGPDYLPGTSWPLMVTHPKGLGGREDPRVFARQGRWHVSWAGVECVAGGVRVHQVVSELDENAVSPVRTWEPRYKYAQNWEKNWGFFGNAGELWAVYSLKPFVVLHLHDDDAFPFSEHDWPCGWIGGHLRGGAPPVAVGEEYYSFFHGALDHGGWPSRTYSVGCLVWPKRPPWKPVRYTPVPIMVPPETGWPRELGVSVVFPAGAVRLADRWLLSVGVHDSWCHVVELDPDLLERAMVKV